MGTVGGAVDRYARSTGVVDALAGLAVAALLVVATVAGAGPASVPDPRPPDAGAVLLVLAVGAAVAVRRRHPVTVAIVLDAAVPAWFLGPYPGRLIALVPLIGCYGLAVRRGWRWGTAGAVLAALVQIVGIRVVLGDTATVGVVPLAVLMAATAASAGAAVGYYRALLAATRAQLAREAQTRDERARLLVAEERLRIARELHDVVGHSMATASVQAGVGLHVIDRRPQQARAALAAIKEICDDGLADVKAVLGVLRDGSPASGPRGLHRLPELVGTAESAGVRVEQDVVLDADGGARPLPAPVDLAAYRIVQEALTNVVRHAGARTVRLDLRREPSRLHIRIRDDGGADRGTDTTGGHGIGGMIERARALSGWLTAAPHPDGGFEVSAELPVPEPR